MTNPLTNIKRFALHCNDGIALRAESLQGDHPIRAVAVLCHPHPLHGGNMHSQVIGGLFAALPTEGIATVRFNFRGTSGSEGRHDGGDAERLDVATALDAAVGLTAGSPIFLIGYSFGALVALATDHAAITSWVAIAPPLDAVDPTTLPTATDDRATWILAGTRDQFCPADRAAELTSGWRSTTVIPLPDQDHFLATAGDDLSEIVLASIGREFGPES